MPDHPDSTEPDATGTNDAGRGRPVLLVVALVLVGVQVLTLVVLAVGGLGGIVSAPAATQINIVTLAVVLLGLAVLIGAAGWALWQGRRWGRGPVVTWQLLVLAVAFTALGEAEWWASVLPIVIAVVVLVGVLAPAS